MPERIQMSRQRPWRAEHPDAVIVARPTKWGNPFQWGTLGRRHAVAAFREMLDGDGMARAFLEYPDIDEIRTELAGRDLACWCPLTSACHADVLLELANQEP